MVGFLESRTYLSCIRIEKIVLKGKIFLNYILIRLYNLTFRLSRSIVHDDDINFIYIESCLLPLSLANLNLGVSISSYFICSDVGRCVKRCLQ